MSHLLDNAMLPRFVSPCLRLTGRLLAAAAVAAWVWPAAAAPAQGAFISIGNASNTTNPGVWEHHQVDVSALVAGASSATLAFDLANDLAGTGSTSTNLPTNAHLSFAQDASAFYFAFEYFLVPAGNGFPFGNASAHFRDASLWIDGVLYRDQYASFADHLGDALLGTASDGDGPGYNILGQTGFEARTFVLAPVPEPGIASLFLAGLGLIGVCARRRMPA